MIFVTKNFATTETDFAEKYRWKPWLTMNQDPSQYGVPDKNLALKENKFAGEQNVCQIIL